MTVHELLTGERAPLSMWEYNMWNTYWKVKQYYQETHAEQQKNKR